MLKQLSKKVSFNSNVLQPYQPRLQHVAAIDGFQIPVTVVGQGTPVLLLHAFGMDARQFLPFVLPLSHKFCFYLPHFRGFGLSADTPTTQFDFIEQYADDVDVLLTHICSKHQTDAVDVAAISMGALVMWAYFNRQNHSHSHSQNQSHSHGQQENTPNNNKVRRYLNIDQSPIVHNQPDWQGGVFGDKQQEVFERFADVVDTTLPYLPHSNDTAKQDSNQPTSTPPSFAELPYPIKRKIIDVENAFSLMSVGRLPARLFVNTMGYQPAHKLAVFEHKTWRQKLKGLQAYLALPYDYREALTHTQTPVTMLIGGQSQLYAPLWQREVAAILPNANTVEIAQSGHAIPLDAPFDFAKALKQFLLAG